MTFSNLAERQVRLGEQRAGNLAADPVGHLPKCAAFSLQVPVQGPAGQPEVLTTCQTYRYPG